MQGAHARTHIEDSLVSSLVGRGLQRYNHIVLGGLAPLFAKHAPDIPESLHKLLYIIGHRERGGGGSGASEARPHNEVQERESAGSLRRSSSSRYSCALPSASKASRARGFLHLSGWTSKETYHAWRKRAMHG